MPHRTLQGSVAAVTNDLGHVLRQEEYKPYGATYAGTSGGSIEQHFQGLRSDEMLLAGGRAYDGRSGIWFARDRLVLLQPTALIRNTSLSNMYGFNYGNPFAFRDVSGLSPDLIGALIGTNTQTALVEGYTGTSAPTKDYVSGGLDIVDAVTNPQRAGERADESLADAVRAADAGDTAGVVKGVRDAEAHVQYAILLIAAEFVGMKSNSSTAKRAAPETDVPVGSIRNVNATRGAQNCVACAIATDATLAGRPATALGGGPYTMSSLMSHFPGRSLIPVKGYGGAQTVMRNWGPGSRAIVWGTRAGEQGHVFNVVNQRGAVRFLDGQTGGIANFEAYDSMYLLRTD